MPCHWCRRLADNLRKAGETEDFTDNLESPGGGISPFVRMISVETGNLPALAGGLACFRGISWLCGARA